MTFALFQKMHNAINSVSFSKRYCVKRLLLKKKKSDMNTDDY